MPVKTVITCDNPNCEQTIAGTPGVSLSPMRGGLRVVVSNENGTAGREIISPMHFCGPECVAGWLREMIMKIPAKPSAPAAANTMTPPPSAVKGVMLALLLGLLSLALPARSQIVDNMTVVSNTYSAPIQTGFLLTSNPIAMPIAQHYLLMTNVLTNVSYTIGYGAQLLGQSGTNLVTLMSLTTNFTAGWAFTNFGVNTNNFSWLYTVPPQYPVPAPVPWGFVSVPGATNATGLIFQ